MIKVVKISALLHLLDILARHCFIFGKNSFETIFFSVKTFFTHNNEGPIIKKSGKTRTIVEYAKKTPDNLNFFNL